MNQNISNLLKQPLLHFVAAAVLIFVAYDFVAEPEAEVEQYSSHQIVIDRAVLLDFLQYRAKAFEPELFNARLNAMSEQELAAVVDEYVKEEAMYREALSMGMETGDYIIRQRLVQKVEFLLENLVSENSEPDGATLQYFYQQRESDYLVDEVYTFTHIFFDAQKDSMEAAALRASVLLAENPDIPFDEASRYGDRYPFLQNYVERTRDFVSNNFSDAFVAELDTLSAESPKWVGPIASRYGQHLVLLTRRTEARVPLLAEIRNRVLDDYRYESQVRKRREAEATVVADYEVILDLQ